MSESKPIRIDLDAVIAERLGEKGRRIPRPVVSWLKKLICQDRLNYLLEHNFPRTGADFCDGVFDDLNIRIDVRGLENLPPAGTDRLIIVCNHPLGGLDGMALISLFTRIYGKGVRFLVNDLLMAVKPLENCFIPINKHGAQSRRSIVEIDTLLAGDQPVIIFPAGLCSRRQNGVIRDLTWHKMFVAKAIEFKRDILPVYFNGRNSNTFYRFAGLRKKLGIRFNLEMILLPREVFKSEGKTFEIICGSPISHLALADGGDPQGKAMEIKDIVYNLKDSSANERKDN